MKIKEHHTTVALYTANLPKLRKLSKKMGTKIGPAASYVIDEYYRLLEAEAEASDKSSKSDPLNDPDCLTHFLELFSPVGASILKDCIDQQEALDQKSLTYEIGEAVLRAIREGVIAKNEALSVVPKRYHEYLEACRKKVEASGVQREVIEAESKAYLAEKSVEEQQRTEQFAKKTLTSIQSKTKTSNASNKTPNNAKAPKP